MPPESKVAVVEGEKILIVDDDPGLRRLLERFLSEQGYRVRAVENTEQMDRMLSRELFHLLVLDLMMPGEDGMAACKRLRDGNNQMPIIMLTAKGDEGSRIQGLEQGADDYLGKPFNPRELLARIKAVLRRQAPVVPGAPTSADETVSFGDYVLFLATRELKKGDEVHMLTTGEFAVLKALVQHAREPLTRSLWFGINENPAVVPAKLLRPHLVVGAGRGAVLQGADPGLSDDERGHAGGPPVQPRHRLDPARLLGGG